MTSYLHAITSLPKLLSLLLIDADGHFPATGNLCTNTAPNTHTRSALLYAHTYVLEAIVSSSSTPKDFQQVNLADLYQHVSPDRTIRDRKAQGFRYAYTLVRLLLVFTGSMH